MGLIIPQTVHVKAHNFTRKYYEEKGYVVGKIGDIFNVSVNDLPQSSTQKVLVICDFCQKEYNIEYRKFLIQKTNGTCCISCRQVKTEITNLKKYGHKCSLRNEEVLQKSKDTNLKNLGVEYPFQSKSIINKTMESQIKKYGKLGRACNTSSQQIYLNKLFGGKLNHQILPYCVDSFFEKENIILEYDGGGHNLSVKLGKCSKKEFENKELIRMNFLKDLDYKQFHIVSKKDKLPNDYELFNIKNTAFNFLLNKGVYYSYNLETKKVISF